MWIIEYYEKLNGRCPTQEFLDTLNAKKDMPHVRQKLSYLRTLGNQLDDPHAHYLRDDIYELRIKTVNGQLRLLYFFFYQEKIIITNGFKKKTDKVPAEHIQLAIDNRKDYLSRHSKKEME